MKGYFVSYVTRKLQIKTTTRYHCTPIRSATAQHTDGTQR